MKHIRLLRFNLHELASTPYKNITDFLRESRTYTVGDSSVNISNASIMEGTAILDIGNKVLRVPTQPEIITINVKPFYHAGDDLWTVLFQREDGNEDSWTRISGETTSGDSIDLVKFPILKGWKYRFIPVDHDGEGGEAFTFAMNANFNIGSSNSGTNYDLFWSNAGINVQSLLSWNSDGTVSANSQPFVEFVIGNDCPDFDAGTDGYGNITDAQTASYIKQNKYYFEVKDPYKTMSGGDSFVEDYQQNHRPFSIVNTLGHIHQRMVTGDGSGISWTNYPLGTTE